jgi:integral membrane protein
MNPFTRLRYVALAEASSFLALLVAAYLKRQDQGELGVQILGPVHGALFIAYVLLAMNVRSQARWSTLATAGILLGAVVPFGGYVVDRWLARNPPRDERPESAG